MPRIRSFVVASLALSSCLTLSGCTNKDAGTDAKAEKQADDAPAPAPAQPEQPAPPSTTEVEPAASAGEAESETGAEEPAPPLPATFDKVGVAVCDDYVAAHVACIDAKMPEAEREAARRVVFENVEVWKQTASGGASAQKGLETACRIALEQAKRATQELGCDW